MVQGHGNMKIPLASEVPRLEPDRKYLGLVGLISSPQREGVRLRVGADRGCDGVVR